MCREDTPSAGTLTTEPPPTMQIHQNQTMAQVITRVTLKLIKNAGNVNLTEKGAISVARIILALVVIDDTLQVKVGEDNPLMT